MDGGREKVQPLWKVWQLLRRSNMPLQPQGHETCTAAYSQRPESRNDPNARQLVDEQCSCTWGGTLVSLPSRVLPSHGEPENMLLTQNPHTGATFVKVRVYMKQVNSKCMQVRAA